MISPLLLRRRRPFIFHEVGSPARMCALPCGAPCSLLLAGGGLWENVSCRGVQEKAPAIALAGAEYLSLKGCGVGVDERLHP
jgi:hypothetical protein